MKRSRSGQCGFFGSWRRIPPKKSPVRSSTALKELLGWPEPAAVVMSTIRQRSRRAASRSVSKDRRRVAGYGEVDETNAAIGLALATECRGELRAALERVQSDLFVLGADLASPPGNAAATVPRVTREMVERLEREIDRFEE